MKIGKIIRIAFADEIFSFVPYRIDDKRSTFETHASKEIMNKFLIMLMIAVYIVLTINGG